MATSIASGLGGSLTVGLIGAEVDGAAAQVAGCGVERFLGVSGPDVTHSRYASDAAAAVALTRKAEATLVIAPGTSRFARTLPGAAHRLGIVEGDRFLEGALQGRQALPDLAETKGGVAQYIQ